jgi:hypothetical protein
MTVLGKESGRGGGKGGRYCNRIAEPGRRGGNPQAHGLELERGLGAECDVGSPDLLPRSLLLRLADQRRGKACAGRSSRGLWDGTKARKGLGPGGVGGVRLRLSQK